MSDDRPTRRLTSLTPMFDNLCLNFFARELADDDKLAETIAGWSR